MSWKNKVQNLGELKVGRKKKIIFKRTSTELNIKSITSSCGCSKPFYDEINKQIIVTYTPKKIPHHLKSQGYYNSVKHITVFYEDGTKDVLTFQSKIIK